MNASADSSQPYREAEDGADETALVVATQLGERGFEHRDQLLDEPLAHAGERLLYQVIHLRVVLVL